MCGICGELEIIPGTRASEPVFEHLVDQMARRGPDASGIWVSTTEDRNVCRLGFRRLAILDLSEAANQPMIDADGRFCLVYNGELYNFRELRAELEQKGFRFRTSGDTEVVLQALIYWGKAALSRFNGMFALGFYDQEANRLLLARDHAGIKPLYYLLSERGIFFASQYDQILAHPWRSGLPVSEAGLGLYLRLGYIPAPYAILQGTHMLEAGSWLCVLADGQVSTGTYYHFPMFQQPDLFGKEALEAVDAAVSAAVKRQMVSDVPLGAFLSGGIDSPLVAAKMQAGSERRVRAYTIGSDGSLFDESDDAMAYAKELGLDHVVEHFTPDQALDWLEDVGIACSEPFADDSIFPTLMVAGLARRDMVVALSGDGGDELFWGYARRFGSILQRATDFQSSYRWRTMKWGLRRAFNEGDRYGYLRWPTIGDWQREKHSLIKQETLSSLFEGQPPWPDSMALYDYTGWELDRTAQWLRWNEFVGHLAKVLLKVDRAGMYHSLEVRVPLLDREVIDIASRIDWRECLDINNETGELPLRHALSRHVQSQTHPKRGFQIPLSDWFRGSFQNLFRETLFYRDDLLGMPIIRPALENLLESHVRGQTDLGRSLWNLLSLALWSDRYLQTSGRPPEYKNEIFILHPGR
jgi:asparagine synthase (glutamine-hydrolysing)